VAFVLQLLSGQYLAYFALGVWAIGGTLALAARYAAARPLRQVGRDAAWLGGASGANALAVLPFALPYALLEAGGELPDNTAHLVLSSMPALRCYLFGSYLIPHVQVPPAAWLLAIPGTIVLALGDRAERTRLAMVLGIGLFGALLSLGPKPAGLGIYRLCVAIFPGFRTAREPHRAAVLVYLAVAILAGCGAAVLVRRPRLGAPVTVAALALASRRRGEHRRCFGACRSTPRSRPPTPSSRAAAPATPSSSSRRTCWPTTGATPSGCSSARITGSRC